ncbi:MATE family efflux transporter [Candidatus Woesearchaeota archaeon]|nr:MATE family efflux transporter [Candidatus Woesearchaeota archaeon]
MKNNRVEEFIKNPKKALFKLSAPMIVAMLVQSLYSIIDTAFVGRLGPEAIAAITFSWPLFFILIALNAGVGIGMSSRIARFLGEKNKVAAENTALHGILLSLTVALLIFVLGKIFLTPLFMLFGAGEVLVLANSYMNIILSGVFLMFPAYVLNHVFISQGNTKTPMIIQSISLGLNAILDPILIYTLGLGIRGAAIATVSSFFVSLVLYLIIIKKKSYLRLNIRRFSFSPKLVKQILAVGIPSSLMILVLSIYVIFINRLMAYFSIEHVAMFGIITRLESLAVMPVVAFSISMVTLVGMFYGAKRLDLVKNISWYALKIAFVYTSIIGLIFFSVPTLFIRIFTPDANLLALAKPFLRLDVLTFPLMAMTMLISRILQGMGLGLPGLVINLIRVIIVAIPLAFFFVFGLGLGYLWVVIAMIISSVISSIVAIVWLESKFYKNSKQ